MTLPPQRPEPKLTGYIPEKKSMKKKKAELILRSIPNAIIFSILGIAFSIKMIPSKLKEYFSFMKQMHKDVWLSELRWDLCDKYGEEWGEPKDMFEHSKVELMQQTCKFCKNTRIAD